MKPANLALRLEAPEPATEMAVSRDEMATRAERPSPQRPPPRFERRAIEIRDQGFAPFRVR